MTVLTFTRPVNARRLAETLTALAGASVTVDGIRQALVSISTDTEAGTISIWVDDSLKQSVLDAIQAAVAAHDASPDPPPPAPPDAPDFGADAPTDYAYQLAAAVTNLRQYLALTATQSAQATAFVPALKFTIRVLLYLVRRQLG